MGKAIKIDSKSITEMWYKAHNKITKKVLLDDFRTYLDLRRKLDALYEQDIEPSKEFYENYSRIFTNALKVLEETNVELYKKYDYQGVLDQELELFIDALEYVRYGG